MHIHSVDPADYGGAEGYHDWCAEHEATILQQCADEGRICGVVGCLNLATHAVVWVRRDVDVLEQVTSCPSHLRAVITEAFGLNIHPPQRRVWN